MAGQECSHIPGQGIVPRNNCCSRTQHTRIFYKKKESFQFKVFGKNKRTIRKRGLFRRASQNNFQSCGGDVVLFFSESHYCKIKMGLGLGTNNYAKLVSLKLLLLFAKERNVKSLQIFGDSTTVVNGSRRAQKCYNLFLLFMFEEIHRILDTFDFFLNSIRHVYMERNSKAALLSKEGIQLGHGQ